MNWNNPRREEWKDGGSCISLTHMNAVLVAVIVMLVLAVARVHVVMALFIGALVGGLTGGLGFDGTMLAFQEGLTGGAKIALSYALLGAFAMAVANSGLPQLLANTLVARMEKENGDSDSKGRHSLVTAVTKWGMLFCILLMAVASQNLIPVHIAFIPLLIPPLLTVFNRLNIDRRMVTCIITFGLVTTYMYLPIGFGSVFLHDILLANIQKAGLDVSGVNVMKAMGIPALGMLAGLLIAIFFSYRRPRRYGARPIAESTPGDTATAENASVAGPISRYRIIIALVAIVATFAIQLVMQSLGFKADGLLVASLVGLSIFMLTGAIRWRKADDVFTQGMKMMSLIGFIMITAQGFASVMNATGSVKPLVQAAAHMFAGNRAAAAFAMLLVGLIVTMGIGSSFSTLPIITTIYVPLCMSLGFSTLATVSIIGTAGALGDAGSPASDSTLGPTAGLNADGQHDHIKDSVIPTFLHFNIPLLLAGWVAALVL